MGESRCFGEVHPRSDLPYMQESPEGSYKPRSSQVPFQQKNSLRGTMFRKRRFGNFGCRLSPSLKEKVTCIEIEVNEFKPVGEESQASLVSLGISFKQEREQQKAIRDMSTSEH